MNTGIQDGVALADALVTAVTRGQEAGLQAYCEQRRPLARRVISMAHRLTRLATVPRAVRPICNLLLRALAHLPACREQLALRLSGLRQ
jgi:2-polyprenyl-6-methoxyphenol hydroxylase-like FAD-dependent oxidoreductase